jgi:glycosyltransferase involved in cell wall biosynthesis
MLISTRKNKVVSFLFKALNDNGAVRVQLALARGLIERGLKVDVVVKKKEGKGQIWLPRGVRVVELKLNTSTRGFSKFLYLFYLVRYLRKEKPVALICEDGINFGSIAKQLARVPTQVIITSHNNLSNYLQNKSSATYYKSVAFKKSLTVFLLRRFLWFYSWADHIVPVSQGIADDLAKMARKPLENIRVIYNPVVTPELLEEAKEPLDHPWFAQGEPPVILGVGRLHQQKDFPTLIRAFALVRQHKPTRLMLLGEGPDRHKLEALIKELGLTNEIALPGFINNPYAFISKASVFVLSSLYEGLPTVLIEAIAIGTKVISTDCPSGPAEILDSGRYGCLVPVGGINAIAEAILTTLDKPTDAEALRHRGQQFSYETAVNKYLELLKI